MVTKEQKTKRRRITALLATCALAIAAIAGVSFFGGSASAAGNSSAEYGEQLKDKAGLAGQGYSFVDSGEMYFGNASSTAKKFVVKNTGTVTTDNPLFKTVDITVSPRPVTPRVILGDTSEGVDIPSTWAGKEPASFTLDSSSVTINSQDKTATITVNDSTIKEVGTSNSGVATVAFSGNNVTITSGATQSTATIYVVCADDTHRAALQTVSVTTKYYPSDANNKLLAMAPGEVKNMKISELSSAWTAAGGTGSYAATSYTTGEWVVLGNGSYVSSAGAKPSGNSAVSVSAADITAIQNKTYAGAHRTADNTPTVFGGALYSVHSGSSGYCFHWYDSTSYYHSSYGYGWNNRVSGDTVVTVVRR